MKMKHIFLAMLAVGLLSACNNENEITGIGDSPAVFSGNIAGQGSAATRAYDTSWEEGDLIGISGTTGEVTYTNVSYTTTGADGNFTVSTPGQDIYFQDEQPVTFTAYYPWSNLTAGVTTIAADTRDQAGQNGFDFLWAQASGSKAQPRVSFHFAHKMTKVVFTIHRGADVSFSEVQSAALSLGGYLPEGTFSVTDGTATADATAALTAPQTFAGSTTSSHNAPSAADATAQTVAYTLILFPQEFAAPLTFTANLGTAQTLTAGLDFSAGNRDAGDTEPKNVWVAGRQYNMDITLNKTSIQVTGCTITEWTEVDAGNVDAQ